MKVRIKNYNASHLLHYNGQIGEVLNDSGHHIYRVRMDDGKTIYPYSPHFSSPQCEIVEETNLIVGNKYVPLKKSVYGSLEYSTTWKNAKAKNQPFLYFQGKNGNNLVFNENIKGSGDFFLEEDVIPYVEAIPEKWVIKVTSENKELISNWRTAGYLSLDCGYCYYSGYKEVDGYWFSENYDLLPEITTEQFKTHILKQKEMKVIGYKFKEDCKQFVKAACVIEKYVAFGEATIHNKVLDLKDNSDSIEKLRNANVLDLWFEPVYEEEFKVGDWVTVTSAIRGNDACDGYTGRITEKDDTSTPYAVDGSWCYDVRKATAQEIERVTTVKIEGYKLEKNSDGSVTFGCQDFSKETVAALKDLFSRTAFKFSCKVNDTEITEEILRKL